MYHDERLDDVENRQVCWDVHYSCFEVVVQKLEYIAMVIYKQQKAATHQMFS